MTSQVTPIFDPEGAIRQIPNEQVKDAIGAGGKIAIQMKAPDGSVRFVPHDQVAAARAAGGEIYDKQGAEQAQQPKEGFWHSLGSVFGLTPETYEAAKQKAAGMSTTQEAIASVKPPNPLDLVKSAGKAVVSEFKKGSQEGQESYDALSKGDITGFLAHQIGQAGHAGATVLAPVTGENLSKAGEQFGQGNIAGGLGTTAGVVAPIAAEAAIKTAPEAVNAINKGRGALAEKVVAPLVRKPLGATLEDTRFGRNPAQAITDEGLSGTKQGMLEQAKNRTGQLADAVDQTLQNHPNSGATIDAGPIIDNAIDNAVSSAKKTGNKAVITRLENLREALKTEYGPTKGTPFEINKLKREVGQIGSDLGAFKSTDPLEASAAGAMADVYSGLKDAVNKQVPEIAPLNERISNLISAQTALKRNLALEGNASILDSHTLFSAGAKIVKKTVASAPVRSFASKILNTGLDAAEPGATPQATGAAATAKARFEAARAAAESAANAIPSDAPTVAYRVRDVGETGIMPRGHAQATTDLPQAQSYVEGRGSAQNAPQEVVKVDLSKLKPSEYTLKTGPGGKTWVQFKKAVPESYISKLAKSAKAGDD